MHKRLIVLLLVFVFLGGLAGVSAIIFRVQEINIVFAHQDTVLINCMDQARDDFEEKIEFTRGRNILIGLNRTRITTAIENHDSRIRVMQIEARFPNRLRILVQERFPKYYIRLGDSVAILDYTLQKICDNERLVGELDLIQLQYRFFFQHFNNDNLAEFNIGDNLRQLEPDFPHRVYTLVQMSHLFFGQDIQEDDLSLLVESINFYDDTTPPGTMVITLRDDLDLGTSIRIEIRDYRNYFYEKLGRAWWILDHYSNQRPSNIIAGRDASGFFTIWEPRG